jgi:cytochrome c-type protein NapB
MKYLVTSILAGLLLISFGLSSQALDFTVNDAEIGLSKESVFDIPTPEINVYSSIEPGELERLPRAYTTLPPQVGHSFDEYLPITLEENACLDCHDRRKYLKREGWNWQVGRKLPMPDDHYGSFSQQGGSEAVAGSRYNCNQCHVPLSDAKPLVPSTFEKTER